MIVIDKKVSLVALSFEEIQELISALQAQRKEEYYDRPLNQKLDGALSELLRDLRQECN